MSNSIQYRYNGDEEQIAMSMGIEESCDFIKVHAMNGVIMNGFLLWANIQRITRAENAWKEEVIAKFLKDEITDAKEYLWRICGDRIPSPKKKQQDASKSTSEVNDICGALKLLAEKECLPMFLASSDMIKETPILITSSDESDSEKEIRSRLKKSKNQ